MSKSNVNPDHYKVAGRERQGEDIVQGRHKTRYSEAQHELGERAQQRSESLRGMAERATAPGGEGEHFERETARVPRSGGGATRAEKGGRREPGEKTTTRSAAKKSASKKRAASKEKSGSKKKAATRRPAASKARAGKSAAKKAAGRKPATRSASKRAPSAKRPARKK